MHLRPYIVASVLIVAAVIGILFGMRQPKHFPMGSAETQSLYYTVQERGSQGASDTTKIYRFSPDTSADVLVATVPAYLYLVGNLGDGKTWIAHTDTELWRLTLATGDHEVLFSLPGYTINNIALNANKTTVALALNKNEDKAVVMTVDISSKQQTKIWETDLGILEAVSIDRWDQDGKHLYVIKGSGDAGAWSAELFRLENHANAEAISVISGGGDGFGSREMNNALFGGEPSADGKYILYTYCPNQMFDIDNQEKPASCPAGGQLHLYDLETKKDRLVYTHTVSISPEYAGPWRVIYNVAWLDSDHAVIATPDGLFSINIADGSKKLIVHLPHTSYGTVPQRILELMRAPAPYVIYHEAGGYAPYVILNTETGKSIQETFDVPVNFIF